MLIRKYQNKLKRNFAILFYLSFQKDAIDSLAEDVDIPKATLRKAARVFHKQNISSVVTEVEDMEALLESI